MNYCDPSTAMCCVEDTGYDVCMLKTAVCPGVVVMCAKQPDCPGGNLCCGTWTAQGVYSAFQCLSTCNATLNEYEVCDPNQQPNECAATGKTCLGSGASGYYNCQ
jgi:hypothetical protein